MRYCGTCGTQLAESSRFCPKCGAASAAEPASAGRPVGAGEFASAAGPAGTGEFASAGGPVGAGESGPGVAHEAATAARQLVEGLVMYDVEAPAVAGEFVVSSWQGPAVPNVLQAAAPLAAGAIQAAASPAAPSAAATQATTPSAAGAVQVAPKRSKLPLVAGLLGLVAVFVVVALYVVPLFAPQPIGPNGGSAGSSIPASVATTSNSPAASSAAGADAANGATAGAASSSPAASGATDSSAPTGGGDSPAVGASPSPTDSASIQPAEQYSTFEQPTLGDFQWLTSDIVNGKVPPTGKTITNLGSIVDGWKLYLFGSNMEWLANANIAVGQNGVSLMIDWNYVHDGSTGEGREDATPNSIFSGTFDAGVLDATGSGRVVLTSFWEQDGHQYAIGVFTWPDGDTCTIALVRP